MDKKTLVKTINELPEDFDLNELIERLIVLDKIEKGRQDVKNGRVFTDEEARKRFAKWLK